MRLRVMAEPTLTLTKEDLILKTGAEFDVEPERAAEILKVVFQGKPVVEYIPEELQPNQELTDLLKEKADLEAANAKLTDEVKDLTTQVDTLTKEKADLEAAKADLEKNQKNNKKGEDK